MAFFREHLIVVDLILLDELSGFCNCLVKNWIGWNIFNELSIGERLISDGQFGTSETLLELPFILGLQSNYD